MTVSFKTTARDKAAISTIADRVEEIALAQGHVLDRRATMMDLSACHANGCPLDFARLATTDNTSLIHDVFGISEHLDRRTGRLSGHFLPRFSRPEHKAAA